MSGGEHPPVTPHRVFRDFLPEETHAALLVWALANEHRFMPSPLAGGIIDPATRRALSLRDLGPAGAELRSHVAGRVASWIEDLRVTAFEPSEIELEMVAYGDGAHFVRHIDTYRTRLAARGDRMLSAVYYFHTEPRRFTGGALRLHRIVPGGSDGIDIVPARNTLVVFPSWGPHEVLPVRCASGHFADSRFAVNCWIYRPRAP